MRVEYRHVALLDSDHHPIFKRESYIANGDEWHVFRREHVDWRELTDPVARNCRVVPVDVKRPLARKNLDDVGFEQSDSEDAASRLWCQEPGVVVELDLAVVALGHGHFGALVVEDYSVLHLLDPPVRVPIPFDLMAFECVFRPLQFASVLNHGVVYQLWVGVALQCELDADVDVALSDLRELKD